jgi:iron complex transport system substrate-binding protein
LELHVRALLIALILALATPVMARTVTDSAGRAVDMPDKIERVFAAGGPAAILIYVLAPDRMVGWPRVPREEEKPFLTQATRSLPEVGVITGRGGSANIEGVLKLKPDLIVDFGSVKETYISLANATQEQTKIPYLLIDGRFEATPASLRLLGAALGLTERAEALAKYVETTFADLDVALAKVPADQRPRVYLARGADGLETGVKGSINTEIIERAGGRNVIEGGDMQKGIVRVSVEQIIVADPDIILTWDRAFFTSVKGDPLWANVKAVREGRVLLAPTAPFGWIDRPPSLNRVIGLHWLAQAFLPERFQQDFRQTAAEFYKLFYQVTPTETDMDGLMAWSNGKAPPRR